MDGDRRHGPNSRIDLRLNEGDRNRSLRVSRSMSLSKAAWRADHSTIRLVEAETACNPPIKAGISSRNPAGPCASRYVIGFTQLKWTLFLGPGVELEDGRFV